MDSMFSFSDANQLVKLEFLPSRSIHEKDW